MEDTELIVNALIREHLGRLGMSDVLKEFDQLLPRTDQDVTSTKILADKLGITNYYRQKRSTRKKGERKVSILETVVEKVLSRPTKSKSKSTTNPKKAASRLKPSTAPKTKTLASAGFDVIAANDNANAQNVADNNDRPPATNGWGMAPSITKAPTNAPAAAVEDMMEEIDLDSMDFNSM